MKKQNRNERPAIRVAIVESDPLRMAGFRALLESEQDIHLESFNLSEIAYAGALDLIILGKRHAQNLSAMMQHLRSVRPDVRVIVTAAGTNDDAILDALANGVKGYLDEAAPATEFVRAIRIVNDGLVWASRRILALFVERSSRGSKSVAKTGTEITHRQREVLQMLVAGRSNKEIALPLGIEERTVKAHVASLMRKIGVQNRIMLSIYAVNHRLVIAQ